MMVKWKMDANFPLNIGDGNREGSVLNYYGMSSAVGIRSSLLWGHDMQTQEYPAGPWPGDVHIL